MTEDVFQKGKLAVLNPAEYWDEIQSLQERDALMTDRIEKLEAALREIAEGYATEWSLNTFTTMLDVAQILSEKIHIARKALEGKDD
jgi:hypothetical protein